ncbi:hypothetical protein [Clostridium sp. AM34-9AC]|jgi:hypothetical protein|uniref:hypothetical protein n=1 Tax=Clostridium sp. AM34-9AC TaxID=2293030 RepID=UPI000E470C41|nr:hypothetical protein [Clostridium sp. AM34-9AC]RHP88160.1 hypothetical protein DXA19_17090 [Firmicutes bacterium AM59-13]RHT21225.1 hypothetical protein DW835_04135 [Clostridium sp. AM34-9AC]
MIELLEEYERPNNFVYPKSIIKLLELNLTNFDVWYFMDKESVRIRLAGLQKRYPERNLIPFARRGDCDDIACFEVGKGEQVYVIHDFASSGYEQRKIYENVWKWLEDVVETMIEFELMEETE